MKFHGFPSIADYERECARLGFTTERRAYRKGEDRFLCLLTLGGGGVSTWYLFTADESAEVLSGIVPNAEWLSRSGGVDRNFTGLLAEHGYIPDDPGGVATPAPEYPAEDDGGEWQQFALF